MLATLTVRSPRERSRPAGWTLGGQIRGGVGGHLAQALADPRQWYLNASWLLREARVHDLRSPCRSCVTRV